MLRKCDNCGHSYDADMRNVNRGWGKCCSKSCAAKLRNKTDSQPVEELVKDPVAYEVKYIAEEPTPTVVTKTAPEPKEEITVFDHYAAHAIATILATNKYLHSQCVEAGMSIAAIAMKERKKYIND